MLRINFIGCGQVGKTLGKLWQQTNTLFIGDILNQSLHSAEQAVSTIAAGSAVEKLVDMQCADIYLISCEDDAIEACSQRLANSQLLKKGDIVFHCSGAQASSLLNLCQAQGAYIASIHPIKSFADIELAANSFQGTYCGVEGDKAALTVLTPLFHRIGAQLIPIDAANKSLYHAASVIACNYLVALQEMSIQTFQQAGVDRDQAMAILHPIVHGTVENIFTLGTVSSLTGPISRGDKAIVSNQLNKISQWNHEFEVVYRSLGNISVAIAEKKDPSKIIKLKEIRALLKKD